MSRHRLAPLLRIAPLALATACLPPGPAFAQNAPAAAPPPAADAAQAEDAAHSAGIRAAMADAMRDAEFGQIAGLSDEQRRKIADYHRQGKAAGLGERVLGIGLGALVGGFVAVEDLRRFIAAHKESGAQSGRLPFPHLHFAAAADKFPEAGRLLARELEAAGKMAAEIQTIRRLSPAALDRLDADGKRRAADAYRLAADGQRPATAANPPEAVKKSIATIETLLQQFK